MTKHQEACDILNSSSTGISKFLQGIYTRADASLNGLDAILSQQGKDGKIHVIAYASCSLCPSKRSMYNYSSAKLEVLVLKLVIMEKFWDYSLGSQFWVYTDNNSPAYIQESKLSASQIWWLSELALFNFTIKCQTGHSNRATDTLSHHQFSHSCDFESSEVKVISYSSVCEAIDQCLNSSKIPEGFKWKALDISCAVQSVVDEEDYNEIVSTLHAVSFLKKWHLKK